VFRLRLTSIRGQLVLWYLGVLVVLLVALGIFQWFTVTRYVDSASRNGIEHGAYRELSILGPCYVDTRSDLQANAQTLAQLLGGYDTAVMIITPRGVTLASHDMGPPGGGHAVHLSLATIQTLIGSPGRSGPRGGVSCPKYGERPPFSLPGQSRSVITSNGLMVVSIPLGPPDRVVGYALLARSMQSAVDTSKRVVVVFAIGAGVILLLTALVALPIINHALRPLDRVASTAEEIAAGNLEERANLTHSSDEVGRLGEAFDMMVDRLQGAMNEITASEERMRRFLADASHELRTPITVLRGSSQVLLRHGDRSSPEMARALREMHEESVRLSRLVEDLLTLSRLDAGKAPPAEPVELGPFLQDLLDRYGSAWPNRAITIAPDLDGLAASINRDALQRILTNLIDNAARYSRPGGAIRLIGETHGEDVALSVVDEGPGMSAEEAKHVFDRFYRAGASRSRGSGGSGLGLSIVCGLVEQSRGSIEIDTAPDRGTTVTVTLPRASRSPAAAPVTVGS
jgi:two-component system OmpR family sensor kinase